MSKVFPTSVLASRELVHEYQLQICSPPNTWWTRKLGNKRGIVSSRSEGKLDHRQALSETSWKYIKRYILSLLLLAAIGMQVRCVFFFLFLKWGIYKRMTPRKTSGRTDGWSTDNRPIYYRRSPWWRFSSLRLFLESMASLM